MALTWRRWVTIFVLACAAVVVWQAPARPDARRQGGSAYRSPLGLRYGWPDAAVRLNGLNLRLRLVELRDSALGPQVIAKAGPGLTIVTDPAIPDSLRAAVRTALGTAWSRYNAGTRFPVTVAIVSDTSKYNDGLPMAHTNAVQAYTFPPDSAAAACRVLVRVTFSLVGAATGETRTLQNRVVRVLTLRSTERALLGPCALYATFGQPGGQITRWLSSTDWEPVQDVDWSQPSPVVQNDFAWEYAGFGSLDAWVAAGSHESWVLRSYLSNDAIGCIGGADARCTAGLEAEEPASKDTRVWRARVIDARNFGVYRGWYLGWGNHLGPAERWLVSDMVRDLGRARFAAFWTSPAGLDTAFAQAAGLPLDRWVQQWARRQYGRDELGPWLPPRTRWAGLVLLLAGLGAAMAFARERQVA